jgi:hypothetical protein
MNISERNDRPSNFFSARWDGYLMLPDRLLATITGFERYREQSVLPAMRDRERLKKFAQ